MHAMRSSHHDGILVLQCVFLQDIHEIQNVLTQNRISLLEADAIGRINNIG